MRQGRVTRNGALLQRSDEKGGHFAAWEQPERFVTEVPEQLQVASPVGLGTDTLV